ncbi:MAG: NUDIX hydrolase [Proteobacteria bacterium]|nr:NUDIX hydrolase [Pseudomonadota bacterium]
MSAVPSPRPAATVLLLRDTADSFEVFMVKRSMKSSFMPGAYVFPGGSVDPEDWETTPQGTDPDDAVARFGGALDGAVAIAHLAAAAREVSEEVNVRLPTVAGVEVFSHWITPAIESKRFDTWFMIATMPADAEPVHDDFETVASRWVEPRAAVERYGDGELVLAPPTYYTLWDLARFGTSADAIAAARERRVVAVQPKFQEVEDRWTILLPGDELFPSNDPVEGPTRIVMGEGGRWWVVNRRG